MNAIIFSNSKQTAIEIEQLNARVVEAETKLKTEVQRIKKKFQIQITELEMSLDVANKTNLDLQKVVKKQSLQLTELQSHYDEVQRQLQQTLDQYGVAQRRIQSITAELEEVRANYENALRSKRTVELSLEDAQVRINELTVINVNLASSKSKLEQEIAQVAADYEEITRELHISDERYQKVQVNSAFYAWSSNVECTWFSISHRRLNSNTLLRFCTRNKNVLSRLKPSRNHWKLKLR